MPSYTIAQFYGEQQSYSCGYCNSKVGRNDYGMWLYNTLPQDYQDLIDRGWRRCGSYCYKPALKNDCCPMYTIRCPANELKLTKSQKKTIKRVNTFIITGDKANNKSSVICRESNSRTHGINQHEVSNNQVMQNISLYCSLINEKGNTDVKDVDHKPVRCGGVLEGNSHPTEGKYSYTGLLKTDPTKCRKAKLKRLERTRQKLLAKCMTEDEIIAHFNEKKRLPVVKSLEQFLDDYKDRKCALDFQVNLVPVWDTTVYEQYFEEEYAVYKNYQMTIHKEDERKVSTIGYRRFLVSSTLQPEEIKFSKPGSPPVRRYGLYHQHYRINGKLIAVGVIDILPACVSAVYFFYDPSYSHLRLGTYSSLRELALVRELSYYSPGLCYYYMGFYIHSCQKVRYKANIKPSYLLCPETYMWMQAGLCQEKLDRVKYTRFNDDLNATDANCCHDVSETLVLYKKQIMRYSVYANVATSDNDLDMNKLSEIAQYSKLVGSKCATRMILYVD